MRVYPQDLGIKNHAELLHRRTSRGWGFAGPIPPLDAPPPRMGRLGRFWTRNSGLTPDQASATVPITSPYTHGSLYLVSGFSAFIGSIVSSVLASKGILSPAEAGALAAGSTGVMAYLGAYLGRVGFRWLNRRITTQEIESLIGPANDEMERAFLSLVRDAIRQTVPEDAESDLRDALRALGEAITRLPVITVTPLDTDALREEAVTLRSQAEAETDRVVADSLERRADAMERRAQANAQSAQIARRSAALKAEITAQMEALREGLAAFHTGGADVAGLADLSEAARRVAAEAVSVASARAELDAAVTETITPAAPIEEAAPTVVQAGRR